MPRDQRKRIEKLEQIGRRPVASGMEAIIQAASVIRAGGGIQCGVRHTMSSSSAKVN